MVKQLQKAIIFLLVSVFVTFSACKGKKGAANNQPSTIDYAAQGYVKATVIFYEIETCGYLLQLEDEKKLEPGKPLSEEFKKDQLAVWVKYVVKKDFVSTCQAGDMIDIADIQIRK